MTRICIVLLCMLLLRIAESVENVTEGNAVSHVIPRGLFTESYYSTLRSHGPITTPSPNNRAIAYRMSRLEAELDQKVGKVQDELYQRSRQVERENVARKAELDRLNKRLERMLEQQRQDSNVADSSSLERRIESLSTMAKVMLGNIRILTSDIGDIKKNLTALTTRTEDIVQSSTDLRNKQFSNHGLMELKHRRHNHCDNCQTPSTDNTFPKHCTELKEAGKLTGLYRIQPENASAAFMVFCDMDTRDGGWTVIQNRYDGSQDFYQKWHDYKLGFGNLGGEFWLGLDNIYYLTGHEVNELLIELEDFNAVTAFARYAAFSLGSELEGYPLKVLGGYSGNAGDSLIYQAGNRFSTKDMDQDGWPEGSCALAHGGGWWYRGCDTSNLNGRYLRGKLPEQFIYQGMYWADFGGPLYSLSKARMLVRPRDENSPDIFADRIKNTTFEDY